MVVGGWGGQVFGGGLVGGGVGRVVGVCVVGGVGVGVWLGGGGGGRFDGEAITTGEQLGKWATDLECRYVLKHCLYCKLVNGNSWSGRCLGRDDDNACFVADSGRETWRAGG